MLQPLVKAGSLTNLAKSPASTVQILGAEKALFRALKSKGNTPKYGLIYHSTFIGRADSKNKGRISRYLANKCAIATRIDSFSDEPTRVYGEKLREQVEERLQFYETGQAPRRNLDVMQEAAKLVQQQGGGGDKMDVDDEADEPVGVRKAGDAEESAKKKKKKRKSKEGDDADMGLESPKKKKKRESKGDDDDDDSTSADEGGKEDKSAKKKKKKKKKSKGGD